MANSRDAHRKTGSKPRKIGILLVHGIGSQRPGDTLLTAGSALYSWCLGWFGENSVSIDRASLATAAGDSQTPAHALFSLHAGATEMPTSWELMESYWADAFRPPAFPELVRWCGRMLVWAPVMYVLPRFQQAWFSIQRRSEDLGRAFLDAGLMTLQFLIVALLWPVLLAALAIILVIGLVPLETTRSFALSLQRLLSGSIGDSYFFVSSPLTKAAILTRVEDDIVALAGRCDTLAIVAHSQGAAVTYDAIWQLLARGKLPKSLASLITYGQGIQRLYSVKDALVNTKPWRNFGLGAYALVALLCSVLAAWIVFPQDALWRVATIVSCIVLFVLIVALLGVPATHLGQAVSVLPLRWTDLYASHDPVAAGAIRVRAGFEKLSLANAFEEFSFPLQRANRAKAFKKRQREVTNRRSVVGDHTTYWNSPDDFVGSVAAELLRLSSIPLGNHERKLLLKGQTRRRWRGVFLGRCRAMALAAAAAVCLSPALVSRLGAEVFVPNLPALVQSAKPTWLHRPPNYYLGAAALISTVALVYLIAEAGWNAWDRREVQAFFPKTAAPGRTYPFELIAGWIAILAFNATLVALDRRSSLLTPAMWSMAFAAVTTALALVSARNGVPSQS